MNDTSHILKTLDDLKQQVATKVAEISQLLSTINVLEGIIGLPKTGFPGGIPSGSPGNGPENVLSTTLSAAQVSLRPDQFLGEEPLDAAKKYLKSVGHAVHVADIADAIQRGGAAIRGGDWREKLEMSLLRSVGDVIKVQEKTFGLTAFYTEDQIKGLRGTRHHAKYGSKKVKRGKGKKASSASAKTMSSAPKALAPKGGLTAVPKDSDEEEIGALNELTG